MKYRILTISLAAVLFAACSVNSEVIDNPDRNVVEEFFATIEDESTRVFADDQLRVLWNADDRVSIFNKNTFNYEYKFTGEDGDNSGSFKKVPKEEFVTGNKLDYAYSVYPYQESTKISNDGAITVMLPAEQTYKANSFGKGANTMIAVTQDDELMFKNLCGYLAVKLYGDNVSVSSITIKGNNNEPLAGKATVNASIDGVPSLSFDSSETKDIKLTFETPVMLGTSAETATTFWVVVPPTSFNKGFTLSVKDNKNGVFERSTNKSFDISRNALTRMAALEVVPTSVVPVTGVSLNTASLFMTVGETKTLAATVTPSNATDKTVIWSSSNSSIATVSSSGLVIAKSSGTATITVKTNDGGIIANCNVTVTTQPDYSKQYFTIEVLSDGIVRLRVRDPIYDSDYSGNTIEMSVDDGQTWINWKRGYYRKGDRIIVRGRNYSYGASKLAFSTSDGATIRVSGNIMSLIDYDFVDLDVFPTGCESAFSGLFINCKGLVSAKDLVLPSNTTESCYSSMFSGCSNLEEGPSLPATKLSKACYSYMFSGCSSLTHTPILPATTLAESCYAYMFNECEQLSNAPVLPATKLANRCYYGMFFSSGILRSPDLPAKEVPHDAYNSMFCNCDKLEAAGVIYAERVNRINTHLLNDGNMCRMFMGCSSLKEVPDMYLETTAAYCCDEMFEDCTSLIKAPKLPAKTLTDYCYYRMFKGCKQLTSIPELPATGLAKYCYKEMFYDCSNLVNIPASLPAKTLQSYCYSNMFEGCTSLTTAPELPATTLAEGCYFGMFADCSSLVNIPKTLPGVVLAKYCYRAMFMRCRSLTKAPILPATSLVEGAYTSMFYSCIKLRYVKALFLQLNKINGNYCTNSWLYGVPGDGTFVKNSSAQWDVSGVSGIPEGWTIEYANE